MDKNKGNASAGGAKRGPKSKAHLPPLAHGLFALGTNNSMSSVGSSNSSTVVNKIGGKREPTTSVTPGILPKKMKSISGRSLGGEQWEDKVLEVESHELYQCIVEADDCNNDAKVDALLCGAVKQLKVNPTKIDPLLYLTLTYLAKTRPLIFCNESVVEAFCSLLRRDPSTSFKLKPNISLPILSANVLLAAFHDENSWPNAFVKVFIDDSLGDRIWVDNDACKGFVDNIITAFGTKMPPKHLLSQDITLNLPGNTSKIESPASSSPNHPSNQDDSNDDAPSSSVIVNELKERLGEDIAVLPRYIHQQDFVAEYVSEVINEQLNRRQVPSEINRNVLKLLISTIGVMKVRLIVSQRLEIWLQNPKLTRPAQDLLLALCMNCNEHDTDVISSLVKMRLKMKPLMNHFVFCIRELINQKEENLSAVLRNAILNELSSARSSNNMQLISVVFQTAPDKATLTLGKIFHEQILKEDCIRNLRLLLREIVRTLRHDFINFNLLVATLTEDCLKYHDIDSTDFAVRERMLFSIADLITLCMFVSISPTIKESLSKNDKKDFLRNFQMQVSEMQRLFVKWMQNVVPKSFRVERTEFLRCLNKGLLMDSTDLNYSKDNWPPDTERNFMLRLVTEVPLQEDTLMRLLNMGLSKDHPITPQEAIELSDTLIKRAASIFDGDFSSSGLVIKSEDVFKLLLKSTSYRIPENISLPLGYEPPSMAISDWYWKVWSQLLIITAHNPNEFGKLAWDSYPTLSLLIEMCITNHFEFPPPTRHNDDFKARELQISALEKQKILLFESHLAAASTKIQINETNSLLLSKLITFDPCGPPRKPPTTFIDQLKGLNIGLRLGHLLCQSRNPDFLLEIIQRQQKQSLTVQSLSGWSPPSMPWLNELIEMNADNFALLPVQCLCEFILGQISDEESNNTSQTELKHSEKVKKKDRRKKFVKMIFYLQNVLKTSVMATKELIEYFMKRLCFQHSAFRILASKALSLILAANLESNESIENIIRNATAENWLLEKLSSINNFESVKSIACSCLKSAIFVETNPVTVCNYIKFLSDYGDEDIKEIALSLAHLLIDRPIITRFLIQEINLRDTFISSALKIFENYLKFAEKECKKEDCKNFNSQDHILVQWVESEKSLVLNILIVHAMIILLTFGPTNLCNDAYENMLETWFCEPPPKAFLVDTNEEALLIPDWIKLKLMKSPSSRLVDAALRDIDTSQLLLFIQSFGLPVSSMEKLLSQLDVICELDPEAVKPLITDEKFMRQLIEVQFMRGVSSGRVFASIIGLQWNKE
ncbi:Integrator complex subunit 1-like protein [Dinothrombium tinctorium]|uniref:Integrator complex subunit 1-like protein n=1 Tax=Dinothrombium tinctorium TaxID=1965070 RepID=A0A3S5WGV1_9ACAR|nr:Integrator complex subunit 1-like protein [Dinothrombium tinctorium]RWS07799.1 Integrator complex subunit 1-like protein [Dinothrombium tinctorium]